MIQGNEAKSFLRDDDVAPTRESYFRRRGSAGELFAFLAAAAEKSRASTGK